MLMKVLLWRRYDRWKTNPTLRSLFWFRFLYFFMPYASLAIPIFALPFKGSHTISLGRAFSASLEPESFVFAAFMVNQVALVLLEIPAGWVADTIKPGRAISAAILLMAVLLGGYAAWAYLVQMGVFAENWRVVFLTQVLIAVPYALIGGADSTLFSRVIRDQGGGGLEEGLGSSIKYAGIAIASGLGAAVFFGAKIFLPVVFLMIKVYLPRVSDQLPNIDDAILYFQLVPLAASPFAQIAAYVYLRRLLRAPTRAEKNGSASNARASVAEQTASSTKTPRKSDAAARVGVSGKGDGFLKRVLFRSPELLSWMLTLAIVEGICIAILLRVQSPLKKAGNTLLENPAISLLAVFGIVVIGYTITAVGSMLGGRIFQLMYAREWGHFGKVAGAVNLMLGTGVVAGLLLLDESSALTSSIVSLRATEGEGAGLEALFVLFGALAVVRGFVAPFVKNLILYNAIRDRLDSHTVLLKSIQSFFVRLSTVVLGFVLIARSEGKVSVEINMSLIAIAMSGAMFVVIAFVLIVRMARSLGKSRVRLGYHLQNRVGTDSGRRESYKKTMDDLDGWSVDTEVAGNIVVDGVERLKWDDKPRLSSVTPALDGVVLIVAEETVDEKDLDGVWALALYCAVIDTPVVILCCRMSEQNKLYFTQKLPDALSNYPFLRTHLWNTSPWLKSLANSLAGRLES